MLIKDFFVSFSIDFLIGYGAFGVIWAVTDPRTSRRVALKKMPNVFQSVVAARRAFREIKMLCTFRHDNVNSILPSQNFIVFFLHRFYKLWIFFNLLVKLNYSMKCKRFDFDDEIYLILSFSIRYILTELMQIDLHKIIVSQQTLSIDHCKVFLYQILRGKRSNFKQFDI